MPKRHKQSFYDFTLLFMVVFITGFGMIMMYSASGNAAQHQGLGTMYFFSRQLIFAVIGITGMIVISLLDYRLVGTWSPIIYIGACVLQLGTAFIGVASHGSSRWIKVAGVRFQPAELVKIAVIIVLATAVTNLANRKNSRWEYFQTILLGCVPGLFIAVKNLSTGLIILGITFIMLFVAWDNYKWFAGIVGAGAAAYVFAFPIAKFMQSVSFLQGYQLDRIFAWKDPMNHTDETFQTIQGLYAIGSGGYFGKGLGESIQKYLMPEAHNDMVFTIICEELGLFGAVSLILIYCFIIYRLYDIARNSADLFGSMLVIGIMAHIALQAILNIAVATNQIPNTGITLPFISYGGTSLLLVLAEMGLALSVSRKTILER